MGLTGVMEECRQLLVFMRGRANSIAASEVQLTFSRDHYQPLLADEPIMF